MTVRPPGGFTCERFGLRTREVGGEGLPGAGGEVDVAETEETLSSEGVSVLKIIFVEQTSHSPTLSSCGHRTPVNVQSQALLRGVLTLLLLLLGAGHFQSIRSL